MLKEQVDSLSGEQKALVSVAYLLANPDLQPEESKGLYKKLAEYDRNAKSIQDAINQARKSINELRPKFDQNVGAITAISSIIAQSIPEDKMEEYCLSFNMAEDSSNKPADPAPSNVIDFAGATAKKLPIPQLND
jgi:hypothetical protein